MKKTLILVIVLMFSLFLSGCEGTGKGITLPVGEKVAASRTIDGTIVTIEIAADNSLLDNSEIVIIAEKLPENVVYTEGSASIEPTFNDDTLLAWLFAKNPPQMLGSLEISEEIPASISYGVDGPIIDPLGFIGKWGLKEANEEGFIQGGIQEGCVFDTNNDGAVDDLDVLALLAMWGQQYNNQAVDDILILTALSEWGSC